MSKKTFIPSLKNMINTERVTHNNPEVPITLSGLNFQELKEAFKNREHLFEHLFELNSKKYDLIGYMIFRYPYSNQLSYYFIFKEIYNDVAKKRHKKYKVKYNSNMVKLMEYHVKYSSFNTLYNCELENGKFSREDLEWFKKNLVEYIHLEDIQ